MDKRTAQNILPLPVSFTDRKSTRLNSSHSQISYAVFCLKKKKKTTGLCICNSRLLREHTLSTLKLSSIKSLSREKFRRSLHSTSSPSPDHQYSSAQL